MRMCTGPRSARSCASAGLAATVAKDKSSIDFRMCLYIRVSRLRNVPGPKSTSELHEIVHRDCSSATLVPLINTATRHGFIDEQRAMLVHPIHTLWPASCRLRPVGRLFRAKAALRPPRCIVGARHESEAAMHKRHCLFDARPRRPGVQRALRACLGPARRCAVALALSTMILQRRATSTSGHHSKSRVGQ